MEIRPYQLEAITNSVRDLRSNKMVGLIIPTGGGKTEIFIQIADRFLDENPDKSVLVLSHLSILTRQTRERFYKRAKHLSVGVLQGSSVPSWRDDVIISTMQTSRNKPNVLRLIDLQVRECGLIIIDEAHHIPCPSYQSALSFLPNAKVLGCTATPFRDRELMLDKFDKISYSCSLNQMIADGYLVKPVLHTVEDVKPTDDDRIGATVRSYKLGHQGQKAIVYLRSIKQAKMCAKLFEDEGIKARAITKETRDRDFDLDAFANGDVNVLTTCDVLTAGYDCDLVQVIFMPFATQSPAKFMQRIGRGLRKADRIGKTKCDIYYYGSTPVFKQNGVSITWEGIKERGGKDKKYDTLREDLEFNDFAGRKEDYQLTKDLVKKLDELRAKGYPEIARQLNERKFPDRFLQDIGGLFNHLKAKVKTKSKITEKQLSLMVKLGFNRDDAARFTKSEASGIISAALRKAPEPSEWIVPEGRWKGRHVREVPHAARSVTKQKYPHSLNAKLYREWDQYQSRRNNG